MLFPAVRIGGTLHNRVPVSGRNDTFIDKLRNDPFYCVHIFAMVFPRSFARTKLGDAATVGVNCFTRWGVGTEVQVIWNAILIRVGRRQRLGREGEAMEHTRSNCFY